MTTMVFFGTSEFAVPALRKLVDSDYQIVAVVTQPDKPAGRKHELLPSPVKIAAQELGLKVLQPGKLEIENWKLKIPEADLYVVASYGKLIPSKILNLPRFGVLNIHPSLLPKYRGPSPIHAAILNGDTETGVSIMKLDEEMDHGDVVANVKLQISNSKIKYKDLHDKLAEMGAELLTETLPKYIEGKIKPVPQERSKATFTKIITKNDARIDWEKTAVEIDRQIRAFHLWPVAWTTLDGRRLKIFSSIPSPDEGRMVRRGGPGEVEIANADLSVQCGSGILHILELQLEGRKKTSARNFANGHPGLVGKILI